jgi:hypothetical protein
MTIRRPDARHRPLALVASLLALSAPAFADADAAPEVDAKRGGMRLNEPVSSMEGNARNDAPRPPEPPAEVLYNLGVARYREGELADAERLFRAAAERGRSEVAARAMFNEGTTAYAEVLRVLEAQAASASPDAPAGGTAADEAPTEESQEDPLEKAIARLESGLRILKDAIRADPNNDDARANAELAQRLLRQLRQQQRQQQQQQDQQNQDQKDQDQQDQDQQNQDQQNQDQQNQDRQNPQQSQEQQSQPQEGQETSESPNEPKPRADEAKERKPLTREEIERLLQRVRAKEAQRLERQALEERARRKPAPKDW